MQTEHILITDPTEQATDIRRAACIIRTGGLDASRRIYAAKGRPSDNPLIIHVASPQDAAMYADTDALYDRLAKAFMPGPLTVIMPRKPIIPLSTTGGLETVAVRCPSHPVAHALIAAAGVRGAIRQSVRQAVAHLRRSRSAGYGRARGHDPGWRRLRDRIGIHHR